MHIDASHPKFEWLSGQDEERIVKINEKGRWNSSKDYEGLYDSIKPRKSKASKATSKKNTPKKKATEKNTAKNTTKNSSKKDAAPDLIPAPSNYGFFFNEEAGYYLLRDAEGKEAHIETSHPKFEWLSGQEAGRVIKINEKGRWNSSKDYKGLYDLLDEVSFDERKQPRRQKRR